MNRNKENAALILATTANYTEAAQRLGITTPTIYEWLKDPEFAKEIHRLRNQITEDGISKLKIYVIKAVETLGLLLDDPNPQIKRGASNDILNHVYKFKELQEFEQRIEILERRTSS